MDRDGICDLLNDPSFRVIKCEVDCMKKTGFTSANIEYEQTKSTVKRKRRRRIERFLLFGGSNSKLNEILDDAGKRIVAKYQFVTEQGVIIVLDYEYLNEGL